MADIISLQELADAKLDAQSLEQFINGGVDEEVLTRLSQQYPTIKKLLLEFQKYNGRAYKTYAEMDADKANLSPKTKVTVTNDETASNNGDWQWDGVAFTKSAYDPLTQAKEYTSIEIEKIPLKKVDVTDLIYGLVDPDGKAAPFPQTGLDGNPTEICAQAIYNSIVTKVVLAIIEQIKLQGLYLQNLDGFVFQLADANGVRTWIEATTQGLPSDWTLKCIKEGLERSGFSLVPSKYKSTYQNTETNFVSGPNIVCYGDSLTYGAGSGGIPYTTVLQALCESAGSNAKVVNAGVGGETSVTIAARQGGNPFVVNVTDKIIPATVTPVVITFEQIGGQTVQPLLQGTGAPSYDFTGKLAGVEGKITLIKPNGGMTWDTANYYTFTRKTAGNEVAVTRPETFYLNFANAHLNDIHIIWIGQNGAVTARAVADAKAMIQHMSAIEKRFIIISKPTSTDADDSLFFAEFGSRFLPIRKYMVEFGLEDAGITPTAQDLIDITNGTVPTSLRTDAVHWNAKGYEILANQLFKKLTQLGWV